MVDGNSWTVEERIDSVLAKLDDLTGDNDAGNQIVAQCFPRAWTIFKEPEQPATTGHEAQG